MPEPIEKTVVTEPRKLGFGCEALVGLMVLVTVGLGGLQGRGCASEA